MENDTPKKLITQTNIAAPKVGSAALKLRQPLLVYSRFDLNRMLLQRAENAGAQIEKTRVLGLDRQNGGWKVRTKTGSIRADFCVIATGARNPLRGTGTEWSAGDTATALGYYVPGAQEQIDIQFLPGLDGYIWVFPRCGHLSVGICGKSQSAQVMRARLEQYMREHSLSYRGAAFFGHVLPSLTRHSWQRNRVAGDRWMAVGDAAGLVDPITGEGLYYAMRSGDLASRSILDESHAPEAKAQAYRRILQEDFGADLGFGILLAERFYRSRFLLDSVPARMVQFTRRSTRFSILIGDLIGGTQTYLGLRPRILGGLRRTVTGVPLAYFFNRLWPDATECC
jgi:flavin-dependent dehydrogenase